MRRRLAWLPMLLTAACGARSDLTTSAPSNSSASSSSSSSSASSSSGTGGAGCSATPPLPITNTVGAFTETFVDSIAVDGSNLLIATSTWVENGPGPDPDPAWRVRLVSGDLASMGPSQIVLTHSADPPFALSPGYVAVGFGHRGFVAWGFLEGSRFVPLAADGAPAAPPVAIGSDVVSWLIATPTGFVALQSMAMNMSPHALLTLDPTGIVIATTPIAGLDPFPYPWPGLIAFDDGSLLLTWGGGTPHSILAKHLDASGAPLAKPAQLFDLSAAMTGNDSFTMTSLGASALVAWGNSFTGGTAARADEDGITGQETAFGPSNIASLGVGAGAAGAFVAWAEIPEGAAATKLVAQPMTLDGAPTGSPFPIAPDLQATAPILASTPAGQVVAFVGGGPSLPWQVYVTRLSCGP